MILPLLFDAEQPFFYAWTLNAEPERDDYSQELSRLVEGVYQLGRGVDLAWAWAEVINETELDEKLGSYLGTIHRPALAGKGKPLACPTKDSLLSLEVRYAANQERFEAVQTGRSFSESFRQLPKPKFQSVAYNSPPVQKLFELRSISEQGQFQVWDLHKAYALVQSIRDAVHARLLSAFPAKAAQIEHWLIGRRADGSSEGKADERIRIIPIPSIGHTHADYGIRRVFIEIPTSCPIRSDDLCWGFNGVELGDGGCHGRLSSADGSTFLEHFGMPQVGNDDDDDAKKPKAKADASEAGENAPSSEQTRTPKSEPSDARQPRAEVGQTANDVMPPFQWCVVVLYVAPLLRSAIGFAGLAKSLHGDADHAQGRSRDAEDDPSGASQNSDRAAREFAQRGPVHWKK